MRRGSKIALLAVAGSVFMLFSAATAFLVGHGVGAGERLAVSQPLPGREQNTLAAMNMTKTAFQSWSLVCRDAPGNGRRCVLFVAVADPEMKQELLTFSVSRTPNGVAVLSVDTPAGLAVDQGVTVTPGAAASITFPVQACGPQRCRAVAELNPSLRAALESAVITNVSYVRANNQRSTYNLPTRGFRDGLAAWSAGNGLRPPASAVN